MITKRLVSSYIQKVPAIVIDKHSSIDMYTYVSEDFMARESTPKTRKESTHSECSFFGDEKTLLLVAMTKR